MARVGVGVAVLALLVAVAACLQAPPAEASSAADLGGLQTLTAKSAPAKCSGAVGECGVDEDEELGGVGESLRRSMAQRQPTNRYIGYAALRADQVPCNKRGRSYYTNCASQQKANPYRRGCSAITRCQRNTN